MRKGLDISIGRGRKLGLFDFLSVCVLAGAMRAGRIRPDEGPDPSTPPYVAGPPGVCPPLGVACGPGYGGPLPDSIDAGDDPEPVTRNPNWDPAWGDDPTDYQGE